MIARTLQLLLVLIPIGLFGWLLVRDIAPSGSFVVEQSVDATTPFRDRILPDERVSGVQYTDAGDAFVTILQDPTYVSVHAPNTDFETLDVEVVFKNDGQPIVEIGALVDIFSQAYDLRPLQNRLIDDLGWPTVTDGDVTLYQREPTYASIDAFLAALPDRAQIATYHYDIEEPYLLANYEPLGGERTIDASLRGYHQYKTYIKNEDLFAEIFYMDMNRTTGADDVAVRVRNQDGYIVYEQSVEDDGNTTENQIDRRQTITIRKNGLPEGVYTVELSGTSDIFWRTIRTTQRYVTFVDRLYIGDDVGYLSEPRTTTFYTNAKQFSLETFHADAAQRIQLGATEVLIPRSHEKVEATVEEEGVVQGGTPRGDVKITGDGKFAFTPDAFFDPDPVSMTTQTDLDALGIQYVLTTYQPPQQVGEWLVNRASFSLPELLDETRSVTLTLSTPHIASLQHRVDIHAVNLEFSKAPLDVRGFLEAVRALLPFGL